MFLPVAQNSLQVEAGQGEQMHLQPRVKWLHWRKENITKSGQREVDRVSTGHSLDMRGQERYTVSFERAQLIST